MKASAGVAQLVEHGIYPVIAHGVEYGRLLQQMQDGKDVVMNHGFPVRVENKDLIDLTCRQYGYIPTFGKTYENEWIEFLGIKKTSTES